MKRLLFPILALMAFTFAAPATAWAQGDNDAPSDTHASADFDAESVPANGNATTSTSSMELQDSDQHAHAAATAAAAAVVAQRMQRAAPAPHEDFLEHLVDSVLQLFNVSSSGNTPAHYAVSLLFLVAALLARRIVTGILFVQLRKFAARTKTTLDDKLFPAMEAPAAAFIVVTGVFAALKVLKLSAQTDQYINNGSTVAFSLVIFWGLWRAFGAILDHANEVARARQLGIAAFMPWIKKTLLTVFIVVGVLLTIQSLGYDVKALLAGLGIGGLAFALAAQDTLANVFGSIVVATDQPFRIGEAVKIGGNIGIVEDIGLRSTRIRLLDKSLMVIPNKTVAAETITNFSRFTRRRVEQVMGLTYDTPPEKMDVVVTAIRDLLMGQPDIDKSSVMVYFRDLNASSLDLWVVYEMPDPDFPKSMAVRQRMNLEIMKLVQAQGLSFAFPTQTVQLDGAIARQLAERRA